MQAKAPLDVDLEDKLLYGLTPMRLAYLALGVVGGLALWSSPWIPSPLHAVPCVAVVGLGAVAAWGRWRGRALDAWVGDISIFTINTHRLVWNKGWGLPRSRTSRPPSEHVPTSPVAIVVSGRKPQAGATTVAIELAACLAAGGNGLDLWSVVPAPAGHDYKPGARDLLLSVAAVEAGRVCYLDRGAGPFVAGLIPEDSAVQRAAALNQATVVAFPDSPASRAFRELAEVITATG
ncbi:MAG: hypothetical protein M3082_03870 [Candidatus Dormibacteraeota bacterium]|nr:hypothetical protein [Candidatus Dormibacteraeota bacterium]